MAHLDTFAQYGVHTVSKYSNVPETASEACYAMWISCYLFS